MNFKPSFLKIILSIVIPIIIFYLLFGLVIFGREYFIPINYLNEIILFHDFNAAILIWRWQIGFMIILYLIWSLIQKKK